MNRFLLWLLARPLLGRRANRRLVGMRVTGRRTGTLRAFPVQYAIDTGGLVVVPAHHETKSWWRNLRSRTPVEVLWMGRWIGAQGWVLSERDRDYLEARVTYLARFPGTTLDQDQPLVRVAFDD